MFKIFVDENIVKAVNKREANKIHNNKENREFKKPFRYPRSPKKKTKKDKRKYKTLLNMR